MTELVVHTRRMSDTLGRLARAYPQPPVRVVGHHYGLPIIRYPSGRRATLLSTGRIERHHPKADER